MDIWQIKQVKLGDLIPNAKNPRKISQDKLAALQDKIERLGFHNPIKTDENMQVLGGNQRLKVLLKIAGKDLIVPVMVPNRPLTEEEKQEIIITDNIADGDWDWEKLSKEWDKELTASWGLDWLECDYDDGQNIAQHLEPESQDLIFSCPPYFDLEKYSDLPNDASNQDYAGFIKILDNAFTGAISCLKNNRFAVVVMSDVRDKKGFYLPICDDITRIFAKNGMQLYNEIILVNVAGTAQIRAAQAMKNRKVVRTHQEVLVFYKGDVSKIQKDFKQVEVAEIESEDE